MIKAILFDLDGTLVNTLPLYIKSYRQALIDQGISLTNREIVEICFGKTEKTICESLGIPSKTEEFRKSYFLRVQNHFIEGKLFKGVIDFLNLTKVRKVKLAIVSFAYTWYVKEMVKRCKLDKYIHVIIGFDDVIKAKPDPEAAIAACKKLCVSPDESVVVGDSKSDILMGKNAGCQTILFHPKEYGLFYDLTILKKSHPDKIVKNFDELKKIIF